MTSSQIQRCFSRFIVGLVAFAGFVAVGGEITGEQARRVLEFLESADESRRAATHRASRERGEDFKPQYVFLLERAWNHHAREFERAIHGSLDPRSPAGQIPRVWSDWVNAAADARRHIQTDHNKEQRRLDEMDRLFGEAEKHWRTVVRTARTLSGDDPVAARLEAAAAALREIHGELHWADPRGYPGGELTLEQLERRLALGPRAGEYFIARQGILDAVGALEAANEANNALSWADRTQKTFASILNGRRAVVGLRPLYLNEKLSLACYRHSEEMERLGYFAHESPVEENRTFGLRARRAGFHGASGECIFMGSSDPEAAERAWWYSCGHRLINYAKGPNTLGIGVHNRHWTLNTGRVSR